jgi:hypothetical protein
MSIKGSVYVVTHTIANSAYVVGVHATKASAMKQANKLVKSLGLKWYFTSDDGSHADSIDPDGENEISIIKWAVESLESQEASVEKS